MDDRGRAELRDDIFAYPDVPPFANGTVRYVVGEVCVDRASNLFRKEFPTRDDIVRHVNSFRKSSDAEDFLSLSSFVSMARCSKQDIVSLIMLISVAERLSEDGIDFKDWIISEGARTVLENKGLFPITDFEKWKEARETLYSTYREKHGSQRAFLAFLEKHLTDNQKIEVVKGIRTKGDESLEKLYEKDETKSVSKGLPSDHLVPQCFSYKTCWTGHECCPAPGNCRLKSDPCLLSQEFKRTIHLLYDVRSKFVHAAFWGASPPRKDLFPAGITGFIKKKRRLKSIGIGLSYDTFEEFVLSAMKEHFDGLR
jgi:hypothetical protein